MRRCDLEREHAGRRHIVEGVLPGERTARDQHHVVPERDHAGGANTERRVAGLEGRARDIERRKPAALRCRIGLHPHPGRTGERLDREIAEREAVAEFAEDLSGVAVVVCGGAVEEARERDQPIRRYRMGRIGTAGAQVEGTEIPAAVAGDMRGLDIGRAAPVERILGAGVAGRDAEAAVAADAGIDTGDEARKIAPHRRGLPSVSKRPRAPKPCAQNVTS